jgi:UPF0042 nucleotide-binding protein
VSITSNKITVDFIGQNFLSMAEAKDIDVNLMSFGHSHGVPKQVDLFYSVRHFPETNVENYQQYDGRHKRIQNELLNLPEYEDLLKTITADLMKYIEEYHTNPIKIAVGCEHGRHRSVAVIERIAELLGSTYNVQITHRDLQRTKSEKNRQRERTKNRDRKYSPD